MTLGAQFANGRKGYELLVFRAVRSVAAQTLDRKVGVPGIFMLFSDRMGRMFLPVVARTAQIYDRRLLRQVLAV